MLTLSPSLFFLNIFLKKQFHLFIELPRWLSGKESACQCRRYKRLCVRKIPWRRKWQPTLVFSPEEAHGQRSLAGPRLLWVLPMCPWGHKESDVTEYILTHSFIIYFWPCWVLVAVRAFL